MFFDSIVQNDPTENFKQIWSSEMALIQTYSHCLKVFTAPEVREIASYCKNLHELNAERLRTHIERLGGQADHINLSDSLTELPAVLANLLGEELTETILLKIECERLSDYLDKLSTVENDDLEVLQEQLLPNQEKCYCVWQEYENHKHEGKV